MSETVRKLIESYYAAFNNGDIAAMVALLTEDVRHDINQSGAETGKTAFTAFLHEMNRCYRERLTDIVIMTEPGGARAAAEYVVHGEYLQAGHGMPEAHGQAYVLPGGAFFTIRGGRIARVTNYYNLPDWLAQVAK